jgi:hypothetical protein
MMNVCICGAQLPIIVHHVLASMQKRHYRSMIFFSYIRSTLRRDPALTRKRFGETCHVQFEPKRGNMQ